MPSASSFQTIDAARSVRFCPDACLEMRPAAAACGRCRDVCPVRAFEWSASGVRLDAACLGCGQCGAVCPTGVIAVAGFEPPAIPLAALRIECRRVPAAASGDNTWAVPCLGGISPDDLLALVADGHQAIELIDRGWCESCPAGGTRHPARDAVEAAGQALATLGLPASTGIRLGREILPEKLAKPPAPGADGKPLGRRAFFAALLRRTVEAAAPEAAATPSRAACRPSPVAAASRSRRAGTLGRLGELAGKPVPAAFFPRLEVGPACTHDTVCAATCPSGALGIFERNGRTGLDFDAGLCVACELCVRHCPTGALRMLPSGNEGEAHMPGRQALIEHAVVPCPRCGRPYVRVPSRGACPVCRQQDDMIRSLFGMRLAERPLSENETI